MSTAFAPPGSGLRRGLLFVLAGLLTLTVAIALSPAWTPMLQGSDYVWVGRLVGWTGLGLYLLGCFLQYPSATGATRPLLIGVAALAASALALGVIRIVVLAVRAGAELPLAFLLDGRIAAGLMILSVALLLLYLLAVDYGRRFLPAIFSHTAPGRGYVVPILIAGFGFATMFAAGPPALMLGLQGGVLLLVAFAVYNRLPPPDENVPAQPQDRGVGAPPHVR